MNEVNYVSNSYYGVVSVASSALVMMVMKKTSCQHSYNTVIVVIVFSCSITVFLVMNITDKDSKSEAVIRE